VKAKDEINYDDHILVKRVLSGDTDAFSIVISNTEKLVAQIIFKMIPNDEDKKDIAQDVYLKAFNKLDSFKFHSKLSTWIGHIAYNTCINHLGKKKLVLLENYLNVPVKNEELDTDGSRMTEVNYTEVDNFILKKELSKILQAEITSLSPIYNTLLTLYHYEELSYLEIAQITALPEGTIKNYLFRARKMLRENLLKNYKKEDL
jgi:RNA polymerase sigma-70 factor (ECF subfamily)